MKRLQLHCFISKFRTISFKMFKVAGLLDPGRRSSTTIGGATSLLVILSPSDHHNIHLVQRILTEHLLCARQRSGGGDVSSGQNTQIPALVDLSAGGKRWAGSLCLGGSVG